MYRLWYKLLLLFFSVVNAKFPPVRKCSNFQFECDDGECISKGWWCPTYPSRSTAFQCRDRSNTRKCTAYYPHCSSDQSHCPETRKCIPNLWICDGHRDCSHGSDETGCLPDGFKIKDIPGLSRNRTEAESWLLGQKRDWAWKQDTARAVVSLYLSNFDEFTKVNMENALVIKELRLQVAEFLMKNIDQPLSTYQLAMFINALLATCHDPRDFFGFNLVDELHRRVKKSSSLNPFFALTLCNANKIISNDFVAELLGLYRRQMKPEMIDSAALASMALTCLRNKNYTLVESSINAIYNGTSYFNSALPNSTCPDLQLEDGSFGTVYTTALVLQAIVASPYKRTGCNIASAFGFLLSKQNKSGAFSDVMSTYLILPLLHEKTLVDLGNMVCRNLISNSTVQEEFADKDNGKRKVEYSIRVGSEEEITFNMHLRVPVNVTFFDVMHLAAELDPRYRFEYASYPWGKFPYSIFGIANDPEERKYWQLYRIVEGEEIYLEETPNKIIPENNESYVYWYKSTT